MKTVLKETRPLDAVGVDDISAQLGLTLSDYPFLSRREILRLQLGAEEMMLHWMDVTTDAKVQLLIEKKGHWLDISMLLIGPSYRCDPLREENVLGGGLADNLLATLGIGWIYQFDDGENSVYISVEAERTHRVRRVFLSMGLALFMAGMLRFFAPETADVVYTYLVHPLFEIGSHFLTAVVSPMMLLAVIDGILSAGNPKSLTRVGGYACGRFLVSTLLIILSAGIVCAIAFPLRFSLSEGNGLADFLTFITDIVPDNIVTPFADCNMMQIIFIGSIIGISMLFLQRQVLYLDRLVKEANALICRLLAGFEKIFPLFVFLSMAETTFTMNVHGVMSYIKMMILFVLFLGVVVGAQFLLTMQRTGFTFGELWEILQPSCKSQLTSACSAITFSEAYEACQRSFGIERKLVNIALPIGTVMHKPLIASEFVFLVAAAREADGTGMTLGSLLILMLMAFLLSVAYPPVSGGEVTCYTMLLKQMEMSSGLLAVACTLSSLFDNLEAPGTAICTELQLFLVAQKHQKINEDVIRKHGKKQA